MNIDDLEDLRSIIEDRLVAKGMDEDIAITTADEIIEEFHNTLEFFDELESNDRS